MTGAIIPKDWDGSSFDCLQIKWPASEAWRAILLGQMTEPAETHYWDAAEAEALVAARAVADAYKFTAVDQPLQECEILYRHKAFRAYSSAPQSIPANTWTPINFDGISWWTDIGSPSSASGYEPQYSGHAMQNGFHGVAEYWHYDVQATVEAVTSFLGLRLYHPQIGEVMSWIFSQPTYYIQVAADFEWRGETAVLQAQIYTPEPVNLSISPTVSYFCGHITGRV